MEFSEKFIERNIAQLCMDYDKIHGANVNIARITPDLIDGLKPVHRRALYITFLKDQGKKFRKLASISGDTFGRIHPHATTSIDEAVVGLAQEWHNTIPLFDGEGNFGTCHDKETEVLTRSGWKYFKDIDYDDLLASVNPENGDFIFENPISIISYHFKGNLISANNHSLNFAITPDHNMLISKYDSHRTKFDDKFEFIKAKDLPKYSRLMINYYQKKGDPTPIILEEELISNGNILPRVDISMDIWVQFLGIYLADGHMYIDESKKYSYKVIHISAVTKTRKIIYYADILSAMGVNDRWSESTGGFTIINKRIWNMLESYGLFKKRAPEKFIPDFIFDLDYKYIRKFLYGFSMGDGSKDLKWGGISYWTSSKKMAEQLQILLLMSGKLSSVYERPVRLSNIQGREITGGVQYSVYEWVGKNQSIDRRIYTKEIPYNDMVYCAEVPSYHTLITRRKGKILLSGNCSGDRHGASRYIKARLSEYAYACFFEDWKYSVVDMVMGADEETREPVYLPAKYPNVLLNGTLGIGYGMASNIPPFNFKEIVDACIQLMVDPDSNIVLIPDSPTGADVLQADFGAIADRGSGTYYMRCTYEIDDEHNIIKITSLPYQISSNNIREKIADIKEKNGLPELLSMDDLSGKIIDIRLTIRDDVNPYKFMKKLIKEVPDLQKNYAVNITVVNDYESIDYSIKRLMNEWIQWRREQKRIVVSHKRTALLAEQRTNDVKIFLLDGKNLEDTISIFRNNRNRKEIEKKLIEKYRNSEIRMDSLQARALSDMRLYELSINTHEECLKRREELLQELKEIEDILNMENGIDKLIIGELRDGAKRFGKPRKSNVVPWEISVSTKVDGICILQLSSDGMILRRTGTNVDEEPVPVDSNGFAMKVDNDSSFIVVDDKGYHSFIKVKELPVDTEVPIKRYKRPKDILDGNIIAMLPCDIDSNKCCTLITKKGSIKKMKISELGPSKRPYMEVAEDDKILRGIVTGIKSSKDLLIYTNDGMGQRLDPNSIRVTSQNAKGGNGFKLRSGDEIVGCFTISPEENQYIVYVTKNGKMRLNLIDYLPIRDSKHDSMVKLISLNDRDKLVGVVGCNKLDKIQVFFDDGTNEIIEVQHLEEGTMSSEPKKVTKKNAVTSNIVKVKLL